MLQSKSPFGRVVGALAAAGSKERRTADAPSASAPISLLEAKICCAVLRLERPAMASDIFNLMLASNPLDPINFASVHKATDRMVASGLLDSFIARDATGRERQHVFATAAGQTAAKAALFSLHNLLGSDLLEEWRVGQCTDQTELPMPAAALPEEARRHLAD